MVVVFKLHALPEAPNSMSQTGEAAAFPPALGAEKASPLDVAVRCPFQCQMVLPIIPDKWKGNDRVTFSLANFVCLLTLFHLVWFWVGCFCFLFHLVWFGWFFIFIYLFLVSKLGFTSQIKTFLEFSTCRFGPRLKEEKGHYEFTIQDILNLFLTQERLGNRDF